ncbi:Ger(x)C family spore germination protein [Metabacillus sp. GX 13764]|uniref:Ger(x)C family spore germination protein n=1 Tax=Metabacillus kandeliae TaxID=2900151 RepID=UPI001E42E202|nr:Ger(x)C family spore germination protein [Metabacillus kandeliae]MCD7036130.1 Ger(x)C family spore germination protein [Metabacillus kandeliae]
MKKILPVCLLLLFTAGCMQKEVIDEVNFVMGFGVDKAENGGFTGTDVIPVYLKDQPVQTEIITDTGKYYREMFINLQKQSSNPLVYGKLEVALFGEDMAKEGFYDVIDTFQRDASIGSNVFLAVARGKASEVLQADYGTQGTADYLYNMIRQNIETRDVPRNNLHLFLYNYYSEGKDNFLPIFNSAGEGKLEIDGMALFHNKKMVGEIPVDDMMFFKLLTDEYTKGNYNLVLPNGKVSSIKTISSDSKLKIDKKNPNKVFISMKVTGSIPEYSGKKLTPKVLATIEKTFKKIIEKKTNEMITQFKELNTDPIGIGEKAKHTVRGLNLSEWKKNYHNLDVTIKADVEVSESGVVE